MMRLVGIAILVSGMAAHAQTPALFELPAPAGKLPIGTTRWVVTDSSREETFAPGKKRDIEVIAWYPAASATGQPVPRLVVREFFGQEILKQPSAFLNGRQAMPGVTVSEIRK